MIKSLLEIKGNNNLPILSYFIIVFIKKKNYYYKVIRIKSNKYVSMSIENIHYSCFWLVK